MEATVKGLELERAEPVKESGRVGPKSSSLVVGL